VVFGGEGLVVPPAAGAAGAAVEFVPVPPLVPDRRASANGSRAPAPKAGAGLETDLADVPHGDRLPGEIRALLPRRGVVNYIEAAAVVRALEKLAAARPADKPLPAVIAPGSAQVELIRLLLSRSSAFQGRPAPPVGLPSAFREQEHDTVVVSLTRSHAHRAVTFGEGPAVLALALTRARQRLVLFGDVGTLARRAQCSGPLEQLDETAAAHERDLVGRLMDYIHGRGSHREAFALGEGSIS
jgi:hypothetical protein